MLAIKDLNGGTCQMGTIMHKVDNASLRNFPKLTKQSTYATHIHFVNERQRRDKVIRDLVTKQDFKSF